MERRRYTASGIWVSYDTGERELYPVSANIIIGSNNFNKLILPGKQRLTVDDKNYITSIDVDPSESETINTAGPRNKVFIDLLRQEIKKLNSAE